MRHARSRSRREGWPVIGMARRRCSGVVGAASARRAGHPVALAAAASSASASASTSSATRSASPPPGDAPGRVAADGTVRRRRPTCARTRFLHAPATRVSIFMSPLDVHVNRSPVAGTRRRSCGTRAGKFRAAFADKASLDNERNAVVLERAAAARYLVVQIAGALARRIVCRRQAGRSAARAASAYGMIMFGSRVDLYLPPDVEPRVARRAIACAAGPSRSSPRSHA